MQNVLEVISLNPVKQMAYQKDPSKFVGAISGLTDVEKGALTSGLWYQIDKSMRLSKVGTPIEFRTYISMAITKTSSRIRMIGMIGWCR